MRSLKDLPRLMRLLSLLVPVMALVLAASVPNGFMVGRGADGTLTFEICTGDGPKLVDAQGNEVPDGDQAGQYCPWAVFHHSSLVHFLVASQVAFPASAEIEAPAAQDAAISSGNSWHLPKGRGPPETL